MRKQSYSTQRRRPISANKASTPPRRRAQRAQTQPGRCIFRSDGRILTVAEARRDFLRSFWSN